MTKPTLQVISCGAHLSEIDAAIAAITFEAIMDRSAAEQFAERAEADAAKAFIAFLKAPEAMAVIKAKGMAPG